MNRRDFIAGSTSLGLLAGGSLGWPRATSAQQRRLPTIGLLGPWSRHHLFPEIERGLEDGGYVELRDFRWEKSGRSSGLVSKAAELVQLQVASIIAFSNEAALAAKSVTSTTPIIFFADDPMTAGLVDCLDRPGGNLTGAACRVSGLIKKRIEIICGLTSTTDLLVVVTDPTSTPAHDIEVREAEAAAKALGLQLSIIAWTGEHGFEPELAALPHDRKAVMVFGQGLPFFFSGATLAFLATLYKIPAIHGDREAVEMGGLVSYGPRFADAGYAMGVLAARVLKGEKPADLPVQLITRKELVINPWPAKSLGLHIPPRLLARADEVIE